MLDKRLICLLGQFKPAFRVCFVDISLLFYACTTNYYLQSNT